MDRMERIAIEADCNRLINGFNWCVDTFAYDDAIALCTSDVVLHRLDVPFEGEAGLREVFGMRNPARKTCHLVTNAIIDVADADHATGKALCAIYGYIGETAPGEGAPISLPDTIVRNDFRFRRTDAGWRIREVRLSVEFRKLAGD